MQQTPLKGAAQEFQEDEEGVGRRFRTEQQRDLVVDAVNAVKQKSMGISLQSASLEDSASVGSWRWLAAIDPTASPGRVRLQPSSMEQVQAVCDGIHNCSIEIGADLVAIAVQSDLRIRHRCIGVGKRPGGLARRAGAGQAGYVGPRTAAEVTPHPTLAAAVALETITQDGHTIYILDLSFWTRRIAAAHPPSFSRFATYDDYYVACFIRVITITLSLGAVAARPQAWAADACNSFVNVEI